MTQPYAQLDTLILPNGKFALVLSGPRELMHK